MWQFLSASTTMDTKDVLLSRWEIPLHTKARGASDMTVSNLSWSIFTMVTSARNSSGLTHGWPPISTSSVLLRAHTAGQTLGLTLSSPCKSLKWALASAKSMNSIVLSEFQLEPRPPAMNIFDPKDVAPADSLSYRRWYFSQIHSSVRMS